MSSFNLKEIESLSKLQFLNIKISEIDFFLDKRARKFLE